MGPEPPVSDRRASVWGRMENHHIKGGGGSLKSSYTNITPLCTAHHDELHAHGTPTFEAKYDLSLADQAARVESRWTLLHPEVEL